MKNKELLDNIYSKWKEYGKQIEKAFSENDYALESIRFTYECAKETYEGLTDFCNGLNNPREVDLVNEKLKDLLSKLNAQYDVAESLAEDNDTFTEDILFDVWICWMDSVEEVIEKLNLC